MDFVHLPTTASSSIKKQQEPPQLPNQKDAPKKDDKSRANQKNPQLDILPPVPIHQFGANKPRDQANKGLGTVLAASLALGATVLILVMLWHLDSPLLVDSSRGVFVRRSTVAMLKWGLLLWLGLLFVALL